MTTEKESKGRAPTVFMSYSHDSPEHKAWVAGLATDLRRKGIDAILDQWRLRPAMDGPAFMEKGIRDANRVLMVCTPQYARKADAGQGGVGYEKMIVTGELYRDLGSTKFIPIIREGSDDEARPSFLRSRIYIDFRSDDEHDRKLEELVREVHNVPAEMEPPLGPNPFGTQGVSTQPPASEPVALPGPTDMDAESVYASCRELFRRQDQVGWQELLKRTRGPVEEVLLRWLNANAHPRLPSKEDHFVFVDSALGIVMPLFALALASVESTLTHSVDQRAVVDDLLGIDKWPGSGRVAVVRLPQALVYVFHYLHGATCMFTKQHKVALDLATMPILESGDKYSAPLWKNHEVTGWPKSLSGACRDAWKYLHGLREKFPWLRSVFVRDRDFGVSLTAYNMFLSAVECADYLRTEGGRKALSGDTVDVIGIEVPPMYLWSSDSDLSKACRLAFTDASVVRLIAQQADIESADLKTLWPKWVMAVAPGFRDPHILRFGGIPCANLP